MLMLIGLSCFGQKSFNRFRVKALDTASVQVNQGFTSISTMNIAYSGTSIVYVKFYDSYAKPVLSSATPVITLQLGTSAAISPKSLENYADVNFKNGCWIRCATSINDTARIGVQPSVKPLIEITY